MWTEKTSLQRETAQVTQQLCSLLCIFPTSITNQREGVDGVVHGALARHRAPVAQHHEQAGQAVEQRRQRRRRLFETQETNERPLGENTTHRSVFF